MFNTAPGKSEFVTRKQLIDAMLKSAGWKIKPFKAGTPLKAYDRCAIFL